MHKALALGLVVFALAAAGGASAEAASCPPTSSDLFDLVKRPAFREAWRAMLKSAAQVPAWMKTLEGPSSPMPNIPFQAGMSQLGQACKAHDCGDNQIYVLFAPNGRRAWGMLVQSGSIRWLGRPDAQVQRKLRATAVLFGGG